MTPRRTLAATTFGLLAPSVVRAQPRGPIRLLVGLPAGGTIDTVARLLADPLRESLGVPVVVENRTGAGGQLAAQALRAAPADGRTLLLSPDHSMVMLPLTVRAPGYDALTDFAPVGLVARYAGGFAVAHDVPARDLAEFLAWARSNPQRANVGIPAPGSVPQFLVHLLAERSGAALASVPYRGSAPLVQDLLGGQLTAGTTALGDFLEHLPTGAVRVIAVLGTGRSSLVADVPTFAEQGIPVSWAYWLGLFTPAGTPPAEIARINAALTTALARADIQDRMRRVVFEPAPGPPDALAEQIRTDIAFWSPVVRSAGWVTQ